MLPTKQREIHSESIFSLFRQFLKVCIIKKDNQPHPIYYLGLYEKSIVLDKKYDNVLINENIHKYEIVKFDEINHLDLELSHLACREYSSVFKLYGKIKTSIIKINNNTNSLEDADVDEVDRYSHKITDFFKQHFKQGNELYKLVLDFRKELLDILGDSNVGATLKGCCRICK